MESNARGESLQELFLRSEFQALIKVYETLVEPSSEAGYWAGLALDTLGDKAEAKVLLEKSLTKGYRGAAAPLAALYRGERQIEHADRYLRSLEPFADLSLWDRAIAYRERGRLLEDWGKFTHARDAYQASWNSLKQLPEGQGRGVLGFVGQLLTWSHEIRGQSLSALEVVREAKRYVDPEQTSQFVQLLYYQVLCASHAKKIREAETALCELQAITTQDPRLQGLIHHAQGVFMYYSKRMIEAIPHFKRSAKFFSTSANQLAIFANLYLGNCHIRAEDLAKARLYYERADHEFISLGPSLAPSYYKRAQAELMLSRGVVDTIFGKRSALKHLTGALEIFNELDLPVGKARAYLLLSQLEEMPSYRD